RNPRDLIPAEPNYFDLGTFQAVTGHPVTGGSRAESVMRPRAAPTANPQTATRNPNQPPYTTAIAPRPLKTPVTRIATTEMATNITAPTHPKIFSRRVSLRRRLAMPPPPPIPLIRQSPSGADSSHFGNKSCGTAGAAERALESFAHYRTALLK